MEKYYIIHNSFGRTTPFDKPISLVKVIEGELSVNSEIFSSKNFKFVNNELEMINTHLAPYCWGEEVKKETFEALSSSFN